MARSVYLEPANGASSILMSNDAPIQYGRCFPRRLVSKSVRFDSRKGVGGRAFPATSLEKTFEHPAHTTTRVSSFAPGNNVKIAAFASEKQASISSELPKLPASTTAPMERDPLFARRLRRADEHWFRAIQSKEEALQFANFRQIIDGDIGL